MQFKISRVEIEPQNTLHNGSQLQKATVTGTCTLSTRWQMIFHFTRDADLIEEKVYPAFGCKNFDKKAYMRCVKLSQTYQATPCPILTKHFADIRHQLMVYLIEHSFVDRLAIRCNHNSLFNTALDTIQNHHS